ncbi:hypothetical protein [Phenylobacterium sp.]|jgi:hypothetical protein|uniref:hypothetical protein n=1 Tax=Phenylobacterium sp. TaxID=1871053 RepID=UPI002F40B177
MAATGALEPPSASPGVLGLTRPGLFAATIVLLLANATAARAIEAVGLSGGLGALIRGLGMSWAFWLAFAVSVRLALREAPTPARSRDLAVCAACALAALVPLSPLAALACTGLAAAILLDPTQGRFLKAAAWIVLAASVQLVWTRILMLVFVQPIANIDAHLVSFIIDRPVRGNGVLFVDRTHTLSVQGGCTSVQNASTGLMLYVAVLRGFRPVPRPSEALVLVGVFFSIVALNIVRLALMAQNIAMFHFVHDGAGAELFNAIITLTGLTWAVASARHEIFD